MLWGLQFQGTPALLNPRDLGRMSDWDVIFCTWYRQELSISATILTVNTTSSTWGENSPQNTTSLSSREKLRILAFNRNLNHRWNEEYRKWESTLKPLPELYTNPGPGLPNRDHSILLRLHLTIEIRPRLQAGPGLPRSHWNGTLPHGDLCGML